MARHKNNSVRVKVFNPCTLVVFTAFILALLELSIISIPLSFPCLYHKTSI